MNNRRPERVTPFCERFPGCTGTASRRQDGHTSRCWRIFGTASAASRTSRRTSGSRSATGSTTSCPASAQVAVKVFGPDLQELRNAAQEIQDAMSRVPGVVDLQIEPQVEISQVRLRVKTEEAARYGLAPGDVARLLETAYKGRTVATVLDQEKYFSLLVWYDEASRNSPAVIGQTILDTPSGKRVALGSGRGGAGHDRSQHSEPRERREADCGLLQRSGAEPRRCGRGHPAHRSAGRGETPSEGRRVSHRG